MYKTYRALLTVALLTATFIVGNTLASMQERTGTTNQTNQNNSRQNGNANRSGYMNRNNNQGMMNTASSGTMSSGMSADMIGNMSREEFERINAQGNAAVAAITPTNTALSRDDQRLMMDVAMGGMRQLEVSRTALQKVTSEEARILAQSEVEEQTGLSAKLREIATAKGVTLPAAPDSKTRSMVEKMQRNSAGINFDRMYVRESGVKGHENLEKVMTRIQSRAADPALRGLASATLPVIRTHLQVSRAVVNNMSGNGRMMNKVQ